MSGKNNNWLNFDGKDKPKLKVARVAVEFAVLLTAACLISKAMLRANRVE